MTHKPSSSPDSSTLSSHSRTLSVGPTSTVHAFGTCQWNRKTIVRFEPAGASSPGDPPRVVYSLEAHVAFPAPVGQDPDLFELARQCMLSGRPDTAACQALRFAVITSVCPLAMAQPERDVVDDILAAFSADTSSQWHVRAYTDTSAGQTLNFIEFSAEIPIYTTNRAPLPEVDLAGWQSIERFVHPSGNAAVLDATLKQTVRNRLSAAPGAAVVLGFA